MNGIGHVWQRTDFEIHGLHFVSTLVHSLHSLTLAFFLGAAEVRSLHDLNSTTSYVRDFGEIKLLHAFSQY